MTQIYLDDIAALHCLHPTHKPKVSERILDIIEMVRTLIDRGAAFEVSTPGGTHDVYFSVRLFESYRSLSHRNTDALEAGACVEKSEHKRDPMVFALWKGTQEESPPSVSSPTCPTICARSRSSCRWGLNPMHRSCGVGSHLWRK